MNAAKNKGDRYERLAVRDLCEMVPDLVVSRPMRKLGAGRREDTGDLHVLNDTAIQVKAYRSPETAVSTAAVGAYQQAINGDLPYHVGMVWVPRARQGSVQWLFVCLDWPHHMAPPMPTVSSSGKAIAIVRDESETPRDLRAAVVSRAGKTLIVSTGQAWFRGYREARGLV